MTNEPMTHQANEADSSALPPGPFLYQTTALPDKHDGAGHVYIVDATGRKVASIWGPKESKIALAEMIVEARSKLP